MSKLEFLRVFLNERLTAAAVEIFGAVEKTVVGYQEENDRLRRQLCITPKITCIDSLQLSPIASEEEVPPEQQHCEQEWSPSLGQEDLEHTEIKEEQEELGTSQEEEQLQRLEADIIEFKFTPFCVKSEWDQEDPLWSLTLPQTQTVENRDSDSKTVDSKPFGTVTHLKGLDNPSDPPYNQNNDSSHCSVVSRNPVGLDSSPPLGEHCFKPITMSRKTHSFCDCAETFALKADLQRHVTLPKKRPSECCFYKKDYNSTCKLKAHVQLCHGGKPCTCPVCGKTFKVKGDLSKHMMIHTEEKPFSCSCDDSGKSFNLKEHLTIDILTGAGKKPFSCGVCGKGFSQKGSLKKHIFTHTGEKRFTCSDCGKGFHQKWTLSEHIRIHTGEKPFSCGDCGKSFNLKGNLRKHKLTHTGDKPFSCGDCGKSFNLKGNLRKHKLTHTGEKPFSCCDCGKSFNLKQHLNMHKLTHTGEKPFSCGDCGRSFTQKSSLLTHVKTHHKGIKLDEN
ncbi:gastrula zinc finger protein XlCGF57.1-like [Salmo salar]|uniref:Gastrula zinc finger protein XlCGF57.1-like n=1 Tax=Salmo salar TaxID=8030 RepID=A0A1S3SEK3_SALSA|nr:gastrula zinc finger protein XlCGF57.1-like [Salmo salar]